MSSVIEKKSDSKNFTVAFVGLPSAGKSSVINSLLGKRELQSGVCRTTKERNNNLEDKILIDDEQNKFKVIDLPGICDSEENDDNFNNIAINACTNANLIIWTSDVSKAFITTHELSEYNKLKEHLKTISDNTGQLYHYIVMLTKCDNEYICDNENISENNQVYNLDTLDSDEILDDFEDTNISDLINKVKEKLPDEDIILFNAFGRSYHHPKTSKVLKKFVEKLLGGAPKQYNIKFDISKYCKDFVKQQEQAFWFKFVDKRANYLESKLDLVELTDKPYNNLTLKDKICNLNYLTTFYNKCYTKRASLIIHSICELLVLSSPLRRKIDKLDRIKQLLAVLFDYILAMINHNTCIDAKDLHLLNGLYKSIVTNSHLCEYDEELKQLLDLILIENELHHFDGKIRVLNYLFIILPDYHKSILCSLLLDNKTMISIEHTILFLKSLTITEGDMDYIENIFNDFILNNNDSLATQHFIRKIEHGLSFQIKTFEILEDESIVDRINRYSEYLVSLVDNREYILLNKMKVLNQICCSDKATVPSTLFISELCRRGLGFSMTRIICNEYCLNTISNIWNQIYSNIEFDYNGDFCLFVPLDKSEILYIK